MGIVTREPCEAVYEVAEVVFLRAGSHGHDIRGRRGGVSASWLARTRYTRSPGWRFCEPARTDDIYEVAEVVFLRAGSHGRDILGRRGGVSASRLARTRYTRSPRWRFYEPARTDEIYEVAEVAFLRAGSHGRDIRGRR